MAQVTVEVMKGRSIDQRRAFAIRVTDAAVECLGVPRDRVRIRFVDVDPSEVAWGGKLSADAREEAPSVRR